MQAANCDNDIRLTDYHKYISRAVDSNYGCNYVSV